MEHLGFLTHAAGLFGLACLLLLVGHRLRVPPVVAMLLAGMAAGPHGLGLVADAHDVGVFAELGVILLLFVIGLELSLDEVRRFARLIFVGGAVYVGLCLAAVEAVLWAVPVSWTKALFVGFLVALSSTAIVLKELGDAAQMAAPHGRIVVGTLLFQDIAVAPMMLAVPLLAGLGEDPGGALLGVGMKTLGVAALVLWGGRFLVRWLLVRVAAVKSRELLLLTVLAICLGVALATGYLGLSLSLGAFLAGLVVSDSEVSHSVVDAIVPFRDVFTSVFFMSVGMLFDPAFFWDAWPVILGLLAALVVLKVGVGCVAGLCLRYPLHTAILAGLALFQIGEFSFVLAGIGMEHGLLGVHEFQLFLSVAIASMAVTPTLIQMLPRLGVRLAGLRGKVPKAQAETKAALRDHLLIAGFGVGGRTVAQVATEAGIPFVVLEMNPETVRRERARGVPIAYGDVTQPAVLAHWNVEQARALAILVSDPAAVQRAVAVAHELHPGLHIVVRTRYVAEVEGLLAAGAGEVVVEEYETAIEVLVRVLAAYGVPVDDILRLEHRFRAAGYADLRGPRRAGACPVGGVCASLDTTAVRVESGAPLEGLTLAESDLRQRHGVIVAAVRRGSEEVLAPGADWRLAAGDVVHLVGGAEAVWRALPLLRASQPAKEAP